MENVAIKVVKTMSEKNIMSEKRKVILQNLHMKDVVSMFSTSKVSRMIHNLNILEEM